MIRDGRFLCWRGFNGKGFIRCTTSFETKWPGTAAPGELVVPAKAPSRRWFHISLGGLVPQRALEILDYSIENDTTLPDFPPLDDGGIFSPNGASHTHEFRTDAWAVPNKSLIGFLFMTTLTFGGLIVWCTLFFIIYIHHINKYKKNLRSGRLVLKIFAERFLRISGGKTWKVTYSAFDIPSRDKE